MDRQGEEPTSGRPVVVVREAARSLLALAVFALIYLGLIAVGRSSIPGGFYNVLRPAAGFFLAVLLIQPVRRWPALVLVATLVDLASARSYPNLAGIVLVLPLVNSLGVILNASLMRWVFQGRRNPLDLRELAFFLAVTAMASLLFATVAGVIFEAFQHRLPVGEFNAWERWQVWTTANLLGVLVVTPVALTLLKRPGYRSPLEPSHSVGRWAELTLLLAAVAGLAIVIFRDDVLTEFSFVHITYILVPFMIWLILRFDPRVSLTAWMGVALLAAWSTQQGQGPFARVGDSDYERVLAVQVFLCVATLSLLAMGAVLNDRKLKEEELSRSEQRYRAVVEDQTELIVRALPDGVVTFVNGAVCRTLSMSVDDLIGKTWPDLLRAREELEGASASHPTVIREGKLALPGDGFAWFQWTDRVLLDRQGRLVAHQSVGRDISALKQYQEKLRQANARLQTLSSQLIRAQEDERRAVARELHDEVGQTLTALKIDLQRLRRRVEGLEALGQLDDAAALTDRALGEVRNLSLDLRPTILDDFGLVAALRWYLDRQAERAGFVGNVTAVPDDLHPAPEVETTCFRIVQEAVTNAIRHARATRVDVVLRVEGDQLVLEIVDDGEGFDVADALSRASRGQSLGLLGIRERAGLAGGNLAITSSPVEGTRIVARFPMRDEALQHQPTGTGPP